jgi:hypothetical protein
VWEVDVMLVLGVHVQLPGSTRGGGVHQAIPGGPSREHTWGRCTPGSSRGSRYTYQGPHAGEEYAMLVQGVQVYIPGSTCGLRVRQARQGGPARVHRWGRCTLDRSGILGTHIREHTWGRCQARPGGSGTHTREYTWGRCAPGSSRESKFTY